MSGQQNNDSAMNIDEIPVDIGESMLQSSNHSGLGRA